MLCLLHEQPVPFCKSAHYERYCPGNGKENQVITLVNDLGKYIFELPNPTFCCSWPHLLRPEVDDYEVLSDEEIGSIQLVQFEKQRFWVEDNWFCLYVTVTCPRGQVFHFPCHRWLVGDTTLRIPEGTARKVTDEASEILHSQRVMELQERQALYRWMQWQPGIPKCISARSEEELPRDVRFHNEKQSDFKNSLQYALIELSLKKLVTMFSTSWTDLDHFRSIFWSVKSPVAEYVMHHWREDWFFGYQFLNGANPSLIRRCTQIPRKLPVTEEMVADFLGDSTSLQQELQNGKIFIVDYDILDMIPTNVIQGKQQYLAAPVCLLQLTSTGLLMPIAIQLNQVPGKNNPIFLPSDPELDWLLAKMWVRSAEFQMYQIAAHLLHTHLVAEVICVATLRHLPTMHPIFKLLIPHMRYTLEINTRARGQLISENGIFDQAVSTGGGGLLLVAQREYQRLTYTSLCLPDDLKNRGMENVKGYYYMTDGLRIWGAVHRYVQGIVELYYHSDQDVTSDTELQAWIKDIAEEGFVHAPNLGIPSFFQSKTELCKFLAMGIFTCSAEHSALNGGQFDWCAWVPNTPCSMRQPPPTCKGDTTMRLIMESLPDIRQSCIQMAITWHLGRRQPDMVPLGENEYFAEEKAERQIRKFQRELDAIEHEIEERNLALDLKYEYLKPGNIENSITI